jgi:uncharacterized protein YjbJ (UPF0337 family)
MVGSERLQAEGVESKQASSAEYSAAQAQQAKEGTKERVSGAFSEGAGGLTGNEEKKQSGKLEQASGAAKQEMSKH